MENDDVVIEEEYEVEKEDEEELEEAEAIIGDDTDEEKDDKDVWVAMVTPEVGTEPALTNRRPLSSVIASLSLPDIPANPVRELARKIVLQVSLRILLRKKLVILLNLSFSRFSNQSWGSSV